MTESSGHETPDLGSTHSVTRHQNEPVLSRQNVLLVRSSTKSTSFLLEMLSL